MSGAGAPNLSVDATGLRVAIIAGSWHEEIMSSLVSGAQETLSGSGAEHTLFRVAGAFELPLAAQVALTPVSAGGGGFDAAVCLGVIIRGGTPHFDYVCNAVTDGLTRVQLDTGPPRRLWRAHRGHRAAGTGSLRPAWCTRVEGAGSLRSRVAPRRHRTPDPRGRADATTRSRHRTVVRVRQSRCRGDLVIPLEI